MCGIIGYIGDRNAGEVVLHGLKKLEYRGYDSYGIAIFGNELEVIKDKGKISEIKQISGIKNSFSFSAIGHTRWATHGMPSRENAHPHFDCSGKILIVHNGIISNFLNLKKELISKGHVFKSETDTETIAHLVEEELKKDKNFEKALRKAAEKLKGSYAAVAIFEEEKDKIYAMRRESPLIIGIGKNENFVASDISAFLKYTKKAVALDDHEYAVIKKDSFVIRSLKTGKELKKSMIKISWSEEQAEKKGYEHFMLKEIHEQPETIKNALNVYGEDIRKLALMIREADKKGQPVYICGAGTSLHAAMLAEYWFAKLCNVLAIAIDSSELAEKAVLNPGSLVIGITQSGETYDTLSAIRFAKKKKARTAAIVNVIGTTATREVEHAIMQNSGMEIAVCATKSFMGQIIILLRVAIELAKLSGRGSRELEKIENQLEKMPETIERVLEKKEDIKKAAYEHCRTENYIYIGRGITLPLAYEGALKFKEITYLHAEAMSSGLLKHGTISLIDENLTTIAVIPSKGEVREKIMNNIQEIKAREGKVIGIVCGEAAKACDVNLVAPEVHELLSPIALAPICQLLAYYTAVKLKRDVDKPRALAKSVTVE